MSTTYWRGCGLDTGKARRGSDRRGLVPTVAGGLYAPLALAAADTVYLTHPPGDALTAPNPAAEALLIAAAGAVGP